MCIFYPSSKSTILCHDEFSLDNILVIFFKRNAFEVIVQRGIWYMKIVTNCYDEILHRHMVKCLYNKHWSNKYFDLTYKLRYTYVSPQTPMYFATRLSKLSLFGSLYLTKTTGNSNLHKAHQKTDIMDHFLLIPEKQRREGKRH